MLSRNSMKQQHKKEEEGTINIYLMSICRTVIRRFFEGFIVC